MKIGMCEQIKLQPVRLLQDEDWLPRSEHHGKGCTHDLVLNCTELIEFHNTHPVFDKHISSQSGSPPQCLYHLSSNNVSGQSIHSKN